MRARYVTDPSDRIDPADRGLAYGDGLFETMAVRAGRVIRLRLHLDRLEEGSRRLALPLPEPAELSGRIADEARRLGHGTLKLIVTRGPGPRGYAPPTDPCPTVVLLGFDVTRPDASPGLRLATLTSRLGENEKLAGIKHLNRLEQILGRLELESLDADEGLMLSTSGKVIGGTSRNVFAVFGSRVVTPDLGRAGIAGVMRRAVLEACPGLGIDARVAELSGPELATADELFMTNAIAGLQSVSHFDGRRLGSFAMAGRLRAALDGACDA